MKRAMPSGGSALRRRGARELAPLLAYARRYLSKVQPRKCSRCGYVHAGTICAHCGAVARPRGK